MKVPSDLLTPAVNGGNSRYGLIICKQRDIFFQCNHNIVDSRTSITFTT